MLFKNIIDCLPAPAFDTLMSSEFTKTLRPYTPVAGLTKNGNYYILYLLNGTKVRFGTEGSLTPDRPECIDCTITKKCDGGCQFCYMGCNEDGAHADLRNGPARDLLDQIKPYTELAINGNDLSHPDLEWFLEYAARRMIFTNITVNQRHFIKNFETIMKWKERNLIRGIGVSYTGDRSPKMIDKLLQAGDSAVVHVIAGLIDADDWKYLSGHDLKLLILGYKEIGRGITFARDHGEAINTMKKTLERLLRKNINDPRREMDFKTIAFDGLALEQLCVKDWIDPKLYNSGYAGGEGAYTFYLDLVDCQYAISSIENQMIPCNNLTIEEMFRSIKTEPLHQ